MEFWTNVLIWAAFWYGVIQIYRFFQRPGKNSKAIRSDLGLTIKDSAGHYIHYDEPLVCPICGKDFYRWQWTEAEERDPDFRKNYYTHILHDDIYRLPCPTCAKDKHNYILETNRLEHNKEVARWNKLSMKERAEEATRWYTSSAPNDNGPDLSDRTPWGPEDEEN